MNFDKELENFGRKTMVRITMVKRQTALKLFGAIVRDTPVGNPDLWKINSGKNGDDDGSNNIIAPEGYTGGRALANWRFSLNNFDETVSEDVDPSGSLTLSFLQTVSLSADVNDAICMSNGLPYIKKLEYDGHSKQAPAGMVRKNVIRFKALIAKAVQDGKTKFSVD